MTTPTQSANRGWLHPLWIVAFGTTLMAGAWVVTPLYGPWPSNAVAATLMVIAVLFWGPRPATPTTRVSVLIASAALGLLFALLSWWLAPLVARQLPAIGHELQALYMTLGRAPGPVWGAPILALSVTAEELIWRGIFVDWCESRWRTPRVVLVATLAYALPIAFSGSLLLVCVALGLGAVLTIQRIRCHSWVACVVTHLSWNLLVFVVHPVA